MEGKMNNIEVCFTPAQFKDFMDPEAIAVSVDILRATSSIVTAF
jgi:phosphosulfolactate phosphohydrolase-like enzyme